MFTFVWWHWPDDLHLISNHKLWIFFISRGYKTCLISSVLLTFAWPGWQLAFALPLSACSAGMATMSIAAVTATKSSRRKGHWAQWYFFAMVMRCSGRVADRGHSGVWESSKLLQTKKPCFPLSRKVGLFLCLDGAEHWPDLRALFLVFLRLPRC